MHIYQVIYRITHKILLNWIQLNLKFLGVPCLIMLILDQSDLQDKLITAVKEAMAKEFKTLAKSFSMDIATDKSFEESK